MKPFRKLLRKTLLIEDKAFDEVRDKKRQALEEFTQEVSCAKTRLDQTQPEYLKAVR